MSRNLTYQRDGISYPVVITIKAIKNIVFRYRGGTFFVSAPSLARDREILKYLDQFFVRLLARGAPAPSPIADGRMYLLGGLVDLHAGEEVKGAFLYEGGLYYKDDEDLKKKMRKLAKRYLEARVRFHETKMGIKEPYLVKIRDMKTRFGTNSRKTHALTFQLHLIHFRPDLIDAIVIHELAHDSHFDHGRAFYDTVVKYCPEYRQLIKKIRRGEFA